MEKYPGKIADDGGQLLARSEDISENLASRSSGWRMGPGLALAQGAPTRYKKKIVSKPTCELEGASIVLVGAFNPGIFQPSWLGANQLLRAEEVEDASSGKRDYLITREVATFTAGWLELQVTEQRFSAQTSDPAHYSPLRDLVLSTFRLLEHTPFTQMGINRLLHYRMTSETDYNEFGHFLAPKKAWEGLVEKPGMLTLRIIGRKPGDEHVKYTTKVEPSVRLQHGVFIETNEHVTADGIDAPKQLMKKLEESWQPSLEYAKKVAEHLFSEFYKRR